MDSSSAVAATAAVAAGAGAGARPQVAYLTELDKRKWSMAVQGDGGSEMGASGGGGGGGGGAGASSHVWQTQSGRSGGSSQSGEYRSDSHTA